MRRSVLGVLAALALLPMSGGGTAMASPPAAPQIAEVTARWGIYTWDDGVDRCTLIADATLDAAFKKGPPVYAHAYVHFMWVGDGGGTWQDFNFANPRVRHGDAGVHSYVGFMGDHGYYVVDRVRFELTSGRGELLSSMDVGTANTCMNG